MSDPKTAFAIQSTMGVISPVSMHKVDTAKAMVQPPQLPTTSGDITHKLEENPDANEKGISLLGGGLQANSPVSKTLAPLRTTLSPFNVRNLYAASHGAATAVSVPSDFSDALISFLSEAHSMLYSSERIITQTNQSNFMLAIEAVDIDTLMNLKVLSMPDISHFMNTLLTPCLEYVLGGRNIRLRESDLEQYEKENKPFLDMQRLYTYILRAQAAEGSDLHAEIGGLIQVLLGASHLAPDTLNLKAPFRCGLLSYAIRQIDKFLWNRARKLYGSVASVSGSAIASLANELQREIFTGNRDRANVLLGSLQAIVNTETPKPAAEITELEATVSIGTMLEFIQEHLMLVSRGLDFLKENGVKFAYVE